MDRETQEYYDMTANAELEDDKFKKQIKNLLFQKGKYEFNKNIISEIDKKKFSEIITICIHNCR